MADAHVLDRIRWSIKRAVIGGPLKRLEMPARKMWFYARTISDAQHLLAFYRGFNSSFRERSLTCQLDSIFDGFGGLFRPFQNRNELRQMVDYVSAKEPKVVMEIGTARGGTLYMLSRAAHPQALIISIDLPAGLYGGGYPFWKGALYHRMVSPNQRLRLIRKDSHTHKAFEAASRILDRSKVDFLFIDGDHSYEGAKADFIRYRSLVKPGGLIGFHDILPSKLDKRISVAPLWREIKESYETVEFVESYDQGQFGIGIMKAPNTWSA